MEDFKLIVPDASVLIEWITMESSFKKQAFAFQKDFLTKKVDVLIPALCLWEINNFFGRRYEVKKAGGIFSNFLGYKFTQALLSLETSVLAFNIMKGSEKISFYDASYHALAIESGGTFLTADKKYYEKTKRIGSIMLLENYK